MLGSKIDLYEPPVFERTGADAEEQVGANDEPGAHRAEEVPPAAGLVLHPYDFQLPARVGGVHLDDQLGASERRVVDVALARNTEPLLVQPTRGEKLRACDADPVDEGARAPAHATAGATGEWVEYSPAAQALEGTPGRTGAGWVAVALGQPEAHGELLTRGQTAIGEEAEQLPVERGHVGGDALEATCGAVVRPSGSAVFPC